MALSILSASTKIRKENSIPHPIPKVFKFPPASLQGAINKLKFLFKNDQIAWEAASMTVDVFFVPVARAKGLAVDYMTNEKGDE
jgi:hypothetical protein